MKSLPIDKNVTFEDVAGLTIVGYRYGKAPESGRSYNTATNTLEAGVSMASVGYQSEIGSFAVSSYNGGKKHYYIGKVADDTGGDDEILLNELQEVSREQYERLLVTYADTSNKIANAYYNRSERVASRGWDVDLENAQAKRDAMLTAAIETQRM